MRQTLVVSDPLADLARLEGVPSALAAARDAVDLLLRDRGLRTIAPERTVEALVLGAQASAELSADPDHWRPGCLRLATELMALSGLVLVAPGQALSRAHTLVAAGSVPRAALGRLRDSAETADRIAALSGLLTGTTQAPGMVLAAVAHAEIATVRPFGSADDVLARALERMVLVATGVDPRGVVVSEAGHARRAGKYRRALDGYRDGSLVGVRSWILHCLTAYADGAALSPLVTAEPRRT
jgi:hypothetical protein